MTVHFEQPSVAEDPFSVGIQLFNQGAYWHAHEQWEICWRVAQGTDAEFYKALIQTAAALVKWQQGNYRGLRLNWAKAQRRLHRLPLHYRGIDLNALATAVTAVLDNPEQAPAPKLTIVSHE